MRKLQLDRHHWCVVSTVNREPGERSEGIHGLENALRLAVGYINDYGVTKVVIFDGIPADGAKVIARINLDGVP